MNDLIFKRIHDLYFATHSWPRPKAGWVITVDGDSLVTGKNYYCVVYDDHITGDRMIERYTQGRVNYIAIVDKEFINLDLDEIV